jgi:hypothetical protein
MQYDTQYEVEHGISWVASMINSLAGVRTQVWNVIKQMGTVCTYGAFYFLVPLPDEVQYILLVINILFIFINCY